MRLMPQNGEYLWTARPFAHFIPPSSSALGRPRVAPWWEWAVRCIWVLEGRYWEWWYVASGQREAYELGHKHGMSAGDGYARLEILRGIDAVVGNAKR